MTLRHDSGPGRGPSGEPVAGLPGSEVTAAGPAAPAMPAGPGQDRAVRPRPRGALAAALTITGVALLGLAGLTTFLLAGHHRPPPARQPLPMAFRLRTGQCVDSAADGVSGLRVVPCGLAHDGEIYATFGLARQPCRALAATAAIMTESYIVPGQGAWEAGVRTVVCEIRSATGQLTGSVRGLK